jgi:hypothetical protein
LFVADPPRHPLLWVLYLGALSLVTAPLAYAVAWVLVHVSVRVLLEGLIVGGVVVLIVAGWRRLAKRRVAKR